MSNITAREEYCAALVNMPLRYADVIVVLAGEDWEPRIQVAKAIKKQHEGDTPVLVAGGIDDPPRYADAEGLAKFLRGADVSPRHIIIENESQNTREQALNVIRMATENEWRALVLVASPYHIYRAHLTFVRVLQDAGLLEQVWVQAVPTGNVPGADVPWFGPPEGMEEARISLLGVEFAKIEEYAEHVATYEEGLTYLEYWEGQ